MRDWRIRTIAPVIIIHLLAFTALYVFMYRFAVSNLINTHKFGAGIVLDELELTFNDTMVDHGAASLQLRMARQAEVQHLVSLNLYDASGRPMISSNGGPSPRDMNEATVILAHPDLHTAWITRDDDPQNKNVLLFGMRVLDNKEECRSCHVGNAKRIGAIQMGIDLTQPVLDAKARVQRKFGLVGVVWLALISLMMWLREVVIGRPLARIESSLTAAGSAQGRSQGHDLEALALQLNSTLWGLIDGQRLREEDIARHMVRAQQLASLGEIAAGLTHEIKNPVAGVIAALEVLGNEGDTLQAREVHDQMLSELRRVSGTLDSLLRLARPKPPQRADVDMARVVREVTSLFTARFRRQGIAFEVEIADAVPILPLDSGLMVQLLVNLLTNSMQASERGGSVRVLLAPFPRRDGVVLAVSDTGRGIDAENIDRIFDPFFTTKEEGTGLGLAICRQIIEQHGGTITVESERGRGTRFVVLLPAVQPKEVEKDNDVALAAR
jgi:signal transduction histidine kinase